MITARMGDLVQSLQLRRANVDMKSTLDRLSAELATGRSADPLTRLGGDLGALSGLEQSLRMNAAWRDSRNEAAAFAGAQQQALGRMQDLTTSLGRRNRRPLADLREAARCCTATSFKLTFTENAASLVAE